MQRSLICDITKENTSSFLTHIKKILKHYFTSSIHTIWINSLHIIKHTENSIIVTTESITHYESIQRNYEKFTQIFSREYESFFNSVCKIEVTQPNENITNNYIEQSHPIKFLKQETNLDPKFTFENFIITDNNVITFHTVKNIADKIINKQNGNFICITGTIGNGKTHLLQSIGNYIETDTTVQYMTSERFMFLYTKAIANKNIIQFREQISSYKTLFIDDIHFILSKDGTMKELASTIRHILSFGGNVIITSATALHIINGLSKEIQNTFSKANVVNIENPNFALRLKILEYKNKAFNYNVSGEVLELLAKKITSNIRDLETTFEKITIHAKILNNEIDINAANMVLKEIFPTTSFHTISIKTILESICTFFDITKEDILSQSRLQELVYARQIGMYLSLEMTNETAKKIGFEFGGRTHSTVIHSYKSIKKEYDIRNMKVIQNIESLKSYIHGL